jgi:hypothetical protein
MLTLELDSKEAELLLQILNEELSSLDTEIAKTDQKDFKDSLKQRRDAVKGMHGSLKEQKNANELILETIVIT